MNRDEIVGRPARVLRVLLLAGALLLAAPAWSGQAPEKATEAVLVGVVNINTASSRELELLPGVGEARAEAIVALRKERGGFKSVDQLDQVKGIGPSLLERLRPHLAVSGRTTARRP